jgi:hypothetical protein
MLNLVDQSAHKRRQLHAELVPSLEEFLGVLGGSDARWCTRQNNCSCGKRCALREEADEFGDGEDEVAAKVS